MLTLFLLLLKMTVEDVLGDHKEKGKFRKDLQDVLQCSMLRRMPKRFPMLLLLTRMIKRTLMHLNVLLEMVKMEFFNVNIDKDDHNEDSISVMQLTL